MVKNEISQNLSKLITQMPQTVIDTLSDIGVTITNKAQENCPYKTHTLQRSITNKVDNADFTVTVGTNMEYASAVHEGHGSYAGVPFLQQAFDAEMQSAADTFRGLLERCGR